MRRRVVVTGLGVVSPCGIGAARSWRALLEKRSGIGRLEAFDTGGWPVRIAGEVRGLDAAALLGARAARRADRFTHFALLAAREAVEDAGLPRPLPGGERAGVFIGSGIGGIGEIFRGSGDYLRSGWKAISPFFIPRSLVNLAGGQVAIDLGAGGPSLSPATACAAGSQAIGEAFRAIQRGEAELAVAGGAEAPLVPIALAGFVAARALSRRNDRPEAACRPFDRARDGFVMAEGAGVLVLEELSRARARGARIYAELLGYGRSNDAHHLTAPEPEGRGAARCMELALEDAGLDPSQVDHVNAHATGTPSGDRAEALALERVFGRALGRVLVTSTKSLTGHLMGAAGGVEAAFTVLALWHGLVPPTANLEDPEFDLRIPTEPVRAPLRVALSNAFGFGGFNSSLVFARLVE